MELVRQDNKNTGGGTGDGFHLTKIDEQQAEIAALKDKNKLLADNVFRFRSQVDALRDDRHELNTEIAALKAERDALAQVASSAAKQYDDLLRLITIAEKRGTWRALLGLTGVERELLAESDGS